MNGWTGPRDWMKGQPTINLQNDLKRLRRELHNIEEELAEVQRRANYKERRILDIMDELKARGVDTQALMRGIVAEIEGRR